MILRNLRSNLNEENAGAEAMKNVQTIIKDFENSARIKKVEETVQSFPKVYKNMQKYSKADVYGFIPDRILDFFPKFKKNLWKICRTLQLCNIMDHFLSF